MTSAKNNFDNSSENIFIRTYLLLLSLFFISIGLWSIFYTTAVDSWPGLAIISLAMLAGLFFTYVTFISKFSRALFVAKSIGNHEVMVVFVILAGLICAGIKNLKE